MSDVLHRLLLFAAACVSAAVLLSACKPPVETPTPAPSPTPAAIPAPTPMPAPDAAPTQVPTAAPVVPPTATPTPTSDSAAQPTPLPDLVIAIEARLKSNPGIVWEDGCIVSSGATLPFHVVEITAHVRNVGGGDAGSFTVRLNDAVTVTVDGLKAGASTTVVVSMSARSKYVAVVDADSSIEESDESNNTTETLIPIPTVVPLPTCTPKSR